MKKLLSFATLLIFLFILAFSAFAADSKQEVIDLGTVYMENGISCHTMLVIQNSSERTSNQSGYIIKNFSYYGSTIAKVQLNGTFTYDGRTARAIAVSVSHATYNGWSYGGESSWCSGNRVNMSATVTKGSASVPVSATMSCSATGALS